MNEKNDKNEFNEKRDDHIFDEFDKSLNDFGKTNLDEFAKPNLEEKVKDEKKEEAAPITDLTIAPPTETKIEEDAQTRTINKNEFVWQKINNIEKIINRLYIIAIISIFAGPIGLFCCCIPSVLVNIAIIVLGIVYISEVNKVKKIGDFSDFDNLRVKTLIKKANMILIFGIIGLVISILCTIIPLLINIFAGNGFYWSTTPFGDVY